ncbi:MAG: polyprenyl synthetase family protein [Gemmatimonadetes bacterium]|nr:polyprenyl synthetase family protein [Gemmatimonadota bacterium]
MTLDFDLAGYLAREEGRVEAALARAMDGMEDRLSPELHEAVRHGVMGGGKRIRPILCVTAYRAAGGTCDDGIYDLAAALELIHAYSLIHDDLPCMDDAELRRGRPTTHRAHGEDRATVAGAALIPAAALQAWRASGALGMDPEARRRVVATLMEAAGAGGMVGGQWLDLEGEERALGADDLDGLHRRKTGALLVASLIMGAGAAGASEAVMNAMYRYGRAIGLAFQIADDILDATSTAEALGKNPSDTHLGKSTYVSLYGLEEARRKARAQVEGACAAIGEVELEAPALLALARFVVDRRS